MIRVQVQTAFVADNLGELQADAKVALVAAGHTVAASRDATDDAPSPPLAPNVAIIEMTISDAGYDWLYNSPAYGPGAILWSEVV